MVSRVERVVKATEKDFGLHVWCPSSFGFDNQKASLKTQPFELRCVEQNGLPKIISIDYMSIKLLWWGLPSHVQGWTGGCAHIEGAQVALAILTNSILALKCLMIHMTHTDWARLFVTSIPKGSYKSIRKKKPWKMGRSPEQFTKRHRKSRKPITIGEKMLTITQCKLNYKIPNCTNYNGEEEKDGGHPVSSHTCPSLLEHREEEPFSRAIWQSF